MESRLDWRMHLKPWQSVKAWERQIGTAWNPLTGNNIMDHTATLKGNGGLEELHHVIVDIGSRGRPKGKIEGAQMQRAKGFLEELGHTEKCVVEVMHGKSEQ